MIPWTPGKKRVRLADSGWEPCEAMLNWHGMLQILLSIALRVNIPALYRAVETTVLRFQISLLRVNLSYSQSMRFIEASADFCAWKVNLNGEIGTLIE